jgi:hypothetical protein
MNGGVSSLGILSFLSFGLSVIAAVLAIDMYKLLRTGEFGKTWRVLIIASVMLALLQVLRMAEVLNFRAMRDYHLSEVVELCFVMALAYAFHLQRRVFAHEHKLDTAGELSDEAESETEYLLDSGYDESDDESDECDDEAKQSQWSKVADFEARHPSTP